MNDGTSRVRWGGLDVEESLTDFLAGEGEDREGAKLGADGEGSGRRCFEGNGSESGDGFEVLVPRGGEEDGGGEERE